MASPPASDPLAVLASLYTPSSSPPLLVRLASLPRALGWRLELSEDDGGTWTSLEPATGHSTPTAAIQEGSRLIDNWRSSREAGTQAEISFFFTEGKLERRRIQILDNDSNPIEVDGFAAKAEDGTWIESSTPIEAINKAKEHKPIKPIKSIKSVQPPR